ncbi:MAG: hypothetical protein JXB04_03685 [Kiritimatiellae bacterium]|nr:hypothetical protein [Kiritimatiellia bacterium]
MSGTLCRNAATHVLAEPGASHGRALIEERLALPTQSDGGARPAVAFRAASR